MKVFYKIPGTGTWRKRGSCLKEGGGGGGGGAEEAARGVVRIITVSENGTKRESEVGEQ